MSKTAVSEGQSSYQHMQISDSGAKIPQNIKEVDRNKKFKFFECLQALVQGRLPTNEQLDHFLAMIQSSTSLDSRSHMLSADGRSLYQDFQELVRTTREIIYEKNEQELFQNFIYHCTRASDSVAEQDIRAPNMDVGVSSRTARKEGQKTLDSMKAVAKLVTTNADFRTILNELFQLAKEVFGEGVDRVTQKVQTASEGLSSMATDATQNAASTTQTGGPRVQQGIQQASDNIQNVLNQAKDDPMGAAQDTREQMAQQSSSTLDTARKQVDNMKHDLFRQTGDYKGKARTQALEAGENAKGYANTKMPPEKRNALIERLKAILGQIQADPQYQNAIDAIMDLIGTWRQRAQRPAGSLGNEASKVVQDPNVEAAIIEFRVILQRWAQGYGLDNMIILVQNMWNRTFTDPELSQYFDNLSTFMTKAVREPNYVTSRAINSDATALIDNGQSLLNYKYKSDTDALLNEGQIFIEKLNNDPRSREVADNFHRFASHLFYDKHDKLKFKPHLFDDFRYVLLPSMMESFQFIPVPRIEYSDLKVDLMIDNMILTSTDLLPRLFEVSMNNMMRMVPRGNASRSMDANKHDFNMVIRGLEANIRDVDYYVKTKHGFRFMDRGIADVLINKKGMDVILKGKKSPEDSEVPSMVTVDTVKVTIHALTIKMRHSKHPILYTFAQPFIKTVVKKAIAHALETQIREAFTSGDKALATSVRDTRIRTGKNTFGALVDSASSFVTSKVNPDEKTKAMNERKKNSGHYNRTSRVIFDQDGLCVLDPVKHMELKVGKPLHEDPNAMATMPVAAPWVSTAFDMKDVQLRGQKLLPGMRRTQGTLAM
ncbi:hypothetical protein BG011_000285 [Mortierella polycephala]|uniref:Uncharacterized protein n=1 Tax=Mortierella polycephala TaxID=41804 RepID=A0A9P6QBA7_9FUNG|nr:hypothetical protein BG011_000285 [Mortierella polycephala]